jgi:hypothetical protein
MDPPLRPAVDVVRHLANRQAAQRLLDDPRAARITSHGSAFHYLDPVSKQLVRLRGLTTVLQELYWPDTHHWRRSRGNSAAVAADTTHKAPFIRISVTKKRPTTAKQGADSDAFNPLNAARGHVRGSMIHEQLHDALTLDRASFERRNPLGWHPWAKRLLKEILRRDWLPLASEYCVTAAEWDPIARHTGFRLGTALDLVCVTPAGKLIFIEIKTSHSAAHFFAHPDQVAAGAVPDPGFMQGSFSTLRNTACHRAQLQLLASVAMAVRGLGHTEDFEAWVVHMDEAEHVDFVRLSDDFIVHSGALLWRDLRAHLE